jgi:hypothetical protein
LGDEVGVLGSGRRGMSLGDDIACDDVAGDVSVGWAVGVWRGAEGEAEAAGVMRSEKEVGEELASAEPKDSLRGTARNVIFSDCSLW